MTRLKLGMVGGGQGAFIGGVHRMAARLDGHWELIAGALSSDATRASVSAAELGIAPDRSYVSYTEMAQAEAARPDGIDAVTIVTPNHLHAPVASAFLRAGIAVICDKPLTATLDEAEDLAHLVQETGLPFILTQTYTGYPLVREARALVQKGALGRIRMVQVEYLQDWLTDALETSGHKQAAWRMDPAQSGDGGCIADIGTHALNLCHFVTGLAPTAVLADLTAFVPGRTLDDNAQVLLRFEGGAKGMIWASQVAPGTQNGLRIRVVGDKGGLLWEQEAPNTLHFTPHGEPTQLVTRGGPGSGPEAARVTRVPAGHPEGYLEAFATLYAEAATVIRSAKQGVPSPSSVLSPNVTDGLLGMRFIAACLRSSRQNCQWIEMAQV